jgi:predicted alpha/beta hydrolase
MNSAGHEMGASMERQKIRFARRFNEAGFGVLAFDYRKAAGRPA